MSGPGLEAHAFQGGEAEPGWRLAPGTERESAAPEEVVRLQAEGQTGGRAALAAQEPVHSNSLTGKGGGFLFGDEGRPQKLPLVLDLGTEYTKFERLRIFRSQICLLKKISSPKFEVLSPSQHWLWVGPGV